MSESESCRGCAASEEFLEDMPMRRYANPIPACPRKPERERVPGSRGEELGQILEALACQNQLLVDLLGAVNCLTATLLAGRECP